MPNDYVTKSHFDEVIGTINKKLEKLDKLSDQMDWLVGQYRNHTEEHELINNRLSKHSDNLEAINQKLGITI